MAQSVTRQRPVRPLLSKVRPPSNEDSAAYDSMRSQPQAWQWKWKQTSHMLALLDYIEWWQSDDTCHHSHRFNEPATKSGMGSPDWHVSMFNIHLRRILWVYCPGHAGVTGNDRADRLVGKATITDGWRLGRSEALRSLRHYLQAGKDEALNDLPWKDEKGPSSVRVQTNIGIQRQHWGNSWEWGGVHMGLPKRMDTILNWTDLNWTSLVLF